MIKRKNKSWVGDGLISAEMFTSLAIFTGAMAGLIFLFRPGVRKQKKMDLKIFDLIKEHTNEKNTRVMSSFTYFGTHNFFIPANLFLIFYFLFIRKRSWF